MKCLYSLILIFIIVISSIESSSSNISGRKSVKNRLRLHSGLFANNSRFHGKLNQIKHKVPESTGRGILARSPTESVVRRNSFGTPATIGQFPFFGYNIAYLTGNHLPVNICGSSLISTRHVLLAAQCIPQGFYAAHTFFGLVDKVNMSEFRDAVAYAIHPGYNDPPKSNDIALLVLSSLIVPSFRVAPIQLPGPIPHSDAFDDNEWIQAVGFEQSGNGSSSEILSFNFLKRISYSECWSITKSSLTMICAKDLAANSTCFADAGSPLVIDKIIVGFAVTENSQCRNGTNIYVRVSPYLDWLSLYMTI